MDNNSLNNWDEQFRQVMSGFEPDVQPGWSSFKQQLDAAQPVRGSDLVRRAKVAERVAVGATVVAAGLAMWMWSDSATQFELGNNGQWKSAEQIVFEEEERNHIEVPRSELRSSDWLMESLENQGQADAGAARTTKNVVIDGSEFLNLTDEETPRSEVGTDELVTAETESASSVNVNIASEEVVSDAAAIVEEGMNGEMESEENRPLSFGSSIQEACEGTEVSFTLDGAMAQGSFLWNFGDGTFSNEPSPSHTFSNPGTYDITISYRLHNDGNIRTRTVENMVVVRPKPEAVLRWKFASSSIFGEIAVELVDETARSSSSTWLIGNEGLVHSQFEIDTPGVYPVHLIASNAYGCQDDASAEIHVGDRLTARAAARFSPDGDGRYDTFLPQVLAESDSDWRFVVANEAGEIVFETRDALRPWDGALDQGGVANGGQVFRWTLFTTDRDGRTELHADEVLIER